MTTYTELIEVIQQAERDGVDVPALQERINSYFGERMKPYQTERIARTTMTQASEAARLEAWAQSELVEGHIWLSELRGNTREAHRKAHGQTVGIDEPFEVGGELLRYPGDPKGSPSNIINCMCAGMPVLKSEE